MNEATLLLYLLNFAYIGILPLIFFKREGRFNHLWWLTAGPFFLCSLLLIAGRAGYVAPFLGQGNPWSRLLGLAAVPFSAASIALISYTRGTHRIPIALWHQENDAPRGVVTYGAYRRIRHPFYASFILALCGAFMFFPHPVTLFTLIYGFLILNLTAAGEEKRLSASAFGAEYRDYIKHTGRFWPRFNLGRHAGESR
jgi:protein-S-isoprenylcysteine O-methyltransferase Ste14